MALPIRSVTLPSGLTMAMNGNLSPSQLVEIGPSGWLHRHAARAWKMMKVACEGDLHYPLTWTYGGTYRSYSAQVSLLKQRYVTNPTLLQRLRAKDTNYWNGQTWYLVTGAMAATPGTSNHGLGLAMDIAHGTAPNQIITQSLPAPIVNWLIANAWKFGFSAETQSEPWHWRYVEGDRIPQLVIDLENFFSTPTPGPVLPPPPAPPVWDPANGGWGGLPGVPVADRPKIEVLGFGMGGGFDNLWVQYVQWVCRKALNTNLIPVHGVFEEVTRAAVQEIQKAPFITLYPDGWVNEDDWSHWVDPTARK